MAHYKGLVVVMINQNNTTASVVLHTRVFSPGACRAIPVSHCLVAAGNGVPDAGHDLDAHSCQVGVAKAHQEGGVGTHLLLFTSCIICE